MSKGDEAAFARPFHSDDRFIVQEQDGLTKRELFAAMMMQGLLAGRSSDENTVTVEDAVWYADKLLAELGK